jgi:hypothetical protein
MTFKQISQKSLYRFCHLAVVYTIFQKGLSPDKTADELGQIDGEASEFIRIRCPLCGWQPTAASLWQCANQEYPERFFDACGTIWNTFSTHGLCPGCGHRWRWTMCLHCHCRSLHEDWYTKE